MLHASGRRVTGDIKRRLRQCKTQQTCISEAMPSLFQLLYICINIQSSFQEFLFGADGDWSSRNNSYRKTWKVYSRSNMEVDDITPNDLVVKSFITPVTELKMVAHRLSKTIPSILKEKQISNRHEDSNLRRTSLFH